MTRDLDATDLTIHRLIGAWAIKHRVRMTAAGLEELEGVLLRPVFVERDALVEENERLRQALGRCEQAISEAVCNIRKPDIMEWIEIIAQAQAVLSLGLACVGEEMG